MSDDSPLNETLEWTPVTGHVFVIHGVVDHLDYDAVVVPTDEAFSVRHYWDAVLAPVAVRRRRTSKHRKPTGWARRGYGRSPHRTSVGTDLPVWYVAAAHEQGDQSASLNVVMERLALVLSSIASAGVAAQHDRSRPLVAVTPLGIGGGGFGELRGTVVDLLLDVCHAATETSGIDVVIVAKDAAIYSALQARRRARVDAGVPRLAEARTLAKRARDGDLVLFLGAGLSMGAGLPSWTGLLKELGKAYGADVCALVSALKSDLDKAELLSQRGRGPDGKSTIGAAVAGILAGKARFSLAHGLLAALGCTEVVTTNYDRLYERAAAGVARDGTVASLPFDQATAGTPWVLKMHGDVEHPTSIVLTRTDFVRYDALSKPLGAILQSLMATKHVLVVGTSMTDDNFLRLAYEVLEFRAEHGRSRKPEREPAPIGTVVALGEHPAKVELWAKRFDYVPVSAGGKGVDAPRDLAIFLDLVAIFAAGHSHLLDVRFGNLLGSGAELAAAGAARELLAQIAELPGGPTGAWSGLVEGLEELGALSGDRAATA